MRVLVMGAGGVGGFYGGMLARSGHELTFVARGAHLAAMRERGLRVRTGGQELPIEPTRAVGRPAEAQGPVDLVLFTVKGYDTDEAAAALRSVVGPGTSVLTLQNGIESVERLNAALGAEHVLAGTTRIESFVAEPGVIEQRSPFKEIALGEQSGELTVRVEAIAAALREAGATVRTDLDPKRVIWDKFILLAPNSSMTTVCRVPVGAFWGVPEAEALYRGLIEETVAVGRAAGVEWPDDVVDKGMATVRGMPPTMTTSMQRDFEAERRVELEQLTGAVVRKGRELGVPTPRFDAIYAILKVRAQSFGGLETG